MSRIYCGCTGCGQIFRSFSGKVEQACPREGGGRPARPQGFPAFIAKGYFGGVGLVRGAYTEYVSTPRARPACA